LMLVDVRNGIQPLQLCLKISVESFGGQMYFSGKPGK